MGLGATQQNVLQGKVFIGPQVRTIPNGVSATMNAGYSLQNEKAKMQVFGGVGTDVTAGAHVSYNQPIAKLGEKTTVGIMASGNAQYTKGLFPSITSVASVASPIHFCMHIDPPHYHNEDGSITDWADPDDPNACWGNHCPYCGDGKPENNVLPENNVQQSRFPESITANANLMGTVNVKTGDKSSLTFGAGVSAGTILVKPDNVKCNVVSGAIHAGYNGEHLSAQVNANSTEINAGISILF